MTHDEFPFHGFAKHLFKKVVVTFYSFPQKKSFHPVVDRVFFFHPNPWFTKHTGKAFNIQRQRNRAACKVALRYATTPCELTAALGQLHLVGAVVVVCPQVGGRFDGVNLGSGLLGIPPKKKTSYCWMLQKSGYVNTWHGAKKSYWKWWDFSCQFLNWFSRQISEPWVGKQRFLKGSRDAIPTLFCCPRFVVFFFRWFFWWFTKAKHNKKYTALIEVMTD